MLQKARHTGLPFMKMHGLGNDFVVIDHREGGDDVAEPLVRAIGDRHRGVGFDQLAVILPSDDSDVELVFYNQDGSQSAACGNATRCIADYLMAEGGRETLAITTARGALAARRSEDGLVSINMGHPQLDWEDIPLARSLDTLELPIDGAPTATGMGNPHCTFFVSDVMSVDIETLGPRIEHDPLYPERTNVQFAALLEKDTLRMRVWERGVGVTLASGSSSCAVAVAAARKGLTGRTVSVQADGGTLQIDWRDDGVWMKGPTAHAFDGVLTSSFLASV